MKQNNYQYSNSNAVKSILLILLLVGGVVGYLIYNGTFSRDGKNKKLNTNSLSCVLTTASEDTSFGNTAVDEYKYEKNITFDENGKVSTIEFIGSVKIDEYNFAYEDAKNNTWTPDLITNECESYGMKVNTELNDQLREIKSVCKGNFATIEWQDSWKNSIGTTREEIKSYYINNEYTCN